MDLWLLHQGNFMQLIADNREGIHNQETKIASVDKDAALNWLAMLDGNQYTLLIFERKDGWQLMVGGGPAQYIITLGDGASDLTFHNIAGDEAEIVELCAGGQFGEFPQSICATHEQAIQVVTKFFDGEERQENWI
jgi:hypothetical protein